MAYTGITIKELDTSKPDGSSETVAVLDDSDREIKTVLKNQYAITTITEATLLTAAHSVIVFGATCTATLPTASTVASSTYTKQYYFINPVSSGFTGTIGGTVSGVSNPTLAAGETMSIYTDGTSWFKDNAKTATTATNIAMTGEASATSNSAATTLDLGTVTAGDRISIYAYGELTNAGIGLRGIYITKNSGTATIKFYNNKNQAALDIYGPAVTGAEVWSAHGILQITGSGTLVMASTLVGTGSPSYANNQIYAFFLKKQ